MSYETQKPETRDTGIDTLTPVIIWKNKHNFQVSVSNIETDTHVFRGVGAITLWVFLGLYWKQDL